jgi:hypothetical protein
MAIAAACPHRDGVVGSLVLYLYLGMVGWIAAPNRPRAFLCPYPHPYYPPMKRNNFS